MAFIKYTRTHTNTNAQKFFGFITSPFSPYFQKLAIFVLLRHTYEDHVSNTRAINARNFRVDVCLCKLPFDAARN